MSRNDADTLWRTVGHTAVVLASFKTSIPQVYKVYKVLQFLGALTFFFSAEVTTQTKIAYFCYVLSVCEITFWDIEITKMDSY